MAAPDAKARPPFWGRLATRIYLVGLAQMVVVFIGFVVILVANKPDEPAMGDRPPPVLLGPPPGLPGPPGPDGLPGPPRPPPHQRDPLGILPPGAPKPPPIERSVVPLVLLVVGVSSWLLARSLTRPLRQLSATAGKLGAGDLSARTQIDRKDELGEVATAFDEMADRVTAMVRSEKELLANISHELRTPLARIRVALDLANEGDAEMAREALTDIADDLDELEKLISDVLMAARLDLDEGKASNGLPPLRLVDLPLDELVDRSVAKFGTAFAGRELAVKRDDTLPTIQADPVLLRRVIDNLLENAHKYSEAPAPIELAVRVEAGEVVFEVADRGVGVAPEDLPKLFRPFFRGDKSRTRKTGGIGLGLALAKRIVEAHAGTIELAPRPSGGTIARVRLPLGVAS